MALWLDVLMQTDCTDELTLRFGVESMNFVRYVVAH